MAINEGDSEPWERYMQLDLVDEDTLRLPRPANRAKRRPVTERTSRMTHQTLFLAWEDKASRQWFPVGRLDADVERPSYRFRYTGGARRARTEAGFPLLLEFPSLDRGYVASELFPVFRNRIMNSRRPDLDDHLEALDLPRGADPIAILASNGGRRVTDAYEVFPRVERDHDGSFSCRFFLRGWRHISEAGRERLHRLEAGERLHVRPEPARPFQGHAVKIQTHEHHTIGWAPRYLDSNLGTAVAERPGEYTAHVVRLNPHPTPSTHRLLIEIRGPCDGYEPMRGPDYQPISWNLELHPNATESARPSDRVSSRADPRRHIAPVS